MCLQEKIKEPLHAVAFIFLFLFAVVSISMISNILHNMYTILPDFLKSCCLPLSVLMTYFFLEDACGLSSYVLIDIRTTQVKQRDGTAFLNLPLIRLGSYLLHRRIL